MVWFPYFFSNEYQQCFSLSCQLEYVSVSFMFVCCLLFNRQWPLQNSMPLRLLLLLKFLLSAKLMLKILFPKRLISVLEVPFPIFQFSLTNISFLTNNLLWFSAYRTDEGKPWVLPVVQEMEKRLAGYLETCYQENVYFNFFNFF